MWRSTFAVMYKDDIGQGKNASFKIFCDLVIFIVFNKYVIVVMFGSELYTFWTLNEYIC